ncbi:MAG: amidohydrolase family protein [Alphaproteobacteria bacterium]|nr:amidohydrolase family protein [Alphaproteobacteria bacterium]
MSGKTTLIRGGWIVAFDGDRHRILTDGVIVYRGDTIVHVGQSWHEDVDETIDATRNLVMPGLVNAHVHVGAHTGDRMILDGGRADLFRSGFMNYCTTKGINGPTIHDFEDVDMAIRYSLACLLRFGSTTVVDMGGELGGEVAGGGLGPLATHAGELGIRLYTAPGMRSAHHYYDQSGRHQIHWHADDGLATLDHALAFVEAWDGAYDGRVRAILVPLEYHLSSDELLRRVKEAAAKHRIGITMHVAESVLEFQDSVRHTGRTPVAMLHDLGFLGPEVILGHGLYTSGHSQVAFTRGDDLALIAGSGASVAHSPTVFARRGVHLESFQRYLDAGINLAIGTDSYPQDMLGELKAVALTGKIADRDVEVAVTRDIFNAATLGGARALGRDDLGRLAPGAKADILIVDFQRLRMGPFLDPLKALIQCCDGEVIDTVIVDGRTLVKEGRLLAWDEGDLLDGVRRSSRAAWDRFADYWPDNEPIEAVFPAAFEVWKE